MINRPTKSQLLELAKVKIDKNMSLEDRVIYMHFFLDGHSWYMSQYDPQRRRFYGYMIPNDEYHNARWDYFSFDQLCRLRSRTDAQVIRNTHWVPTRAINVDRIRDAFTWQKELGAAWKKAKRRIARAR